MKRNLIIMYSVLTMAILVASSATILYPDVFAVVSLSGQTKSGTLSLSYTRVSAEASGGHYHNTIADAFGFWSLSVDNGISYTVDASKHGYNRARTTGVVGPQSGINQNLSTQTQYTIEFFIVPDEEFRSSYGASWQSTAKDKLWSAVDYFKYQHNINFSDHYYYTTWDSNDSVTSVQTLLTEVKSETGWSSGTRQGANVLWAISAQSLSGPIGWGDIPSGPPSGNNYPGSIVDDASADMAFIVMHELSHNYGLVHNSDTWVDVMNTDTNYDGKNWRPSNDDTMQANRHWY